MRIYRDKNRHALPTTRRRMSRGSCSILFIILLISLPYVGGMTSLHSTQIPTRTSVVGAGIAGATALALAANGCVLKQKRLSRLQGRIIAEMELKRRCEDRGQIYIPAPSDESERDRRNRRRCMNRRCEDAGKKEMRLRQRGEKRNADTSDTVLEERRRIDRDRMRASRAAESPAGVAERKRRNTEHMRASRAAESPAGAAERKRRNTEHMRASRAEESPAGAAERKRRNTEHMRVSRAAESPRDTDERRQKDRKRRAERERNLPPQQDPDEDFLIGGEVPFIEVSRNGAKRARELLLRTTVGDDDGRRYHRALGCVVCDEHIIGVEDVHYITKNQLLEHKGRLGVESYEEFHGVMDEELKKQYEVEGLEGILLSRRFGKDNADTFTVCTCCKNSLRRDATVSPPKYSIANGFAIGSIPETIEYLNKDGGEERVRTVTDVRDREGNVIAAQIESKVTSIMAAALSPVRPYAYIFAYHGGQHTSLRGNFQFFETSQTKLSGALRCLEESGMTSNIYVVINGRMTPTQKDIVRKKAELDSRLYFALLRWLKEHHPGFRDVDIDEMSGLKIELIEDLQEDDTSASPEEENKEEGAVFYFSSGGEPTRETSVYKSSKDLVLALLKDHSAPTLTIHGGNYASHSDVMHLENVFPTVFPFGSGGPTVNRRNKISDEEKIRHYLRLSLPQFMESEFILVANFLLGRILSFKTAIAKCRPIIDDDGTAVGDVIGNMTIDEIKDAIESEQEPGERNDRGKVTADKLLKAVSASCRSLGMTEEAAKKARRKCFALQEFYGMHSLFVTITIDDECSFRIRLYPSVDANGEATPLPPLDLSDAQCIADLTLRKRVRRKYPGACSLEFQSAMQIALDCLFGWDTKTQSGRRGVFGKMEAFSKADEEQGRATLHAHFLLWIENFAHLRRLLFAEDDSTRKIARASYVSYLSKVMSAKQCDFHVKVAPLCKCKDDYGEVEVNQNYVNCKAQDFRQARHDRGWYEIDGRVMQCIKCKKYTTTTDINNGIVKLLQERDESVYPFDHPISKERLDIAAFRTIYDHDIHDLCDVDNSEIPSATSRRILLNERFNQHSQEHARSCFKKGCECRFMFPFLATSGQSCGLDADDDGDRFVVNMSETEWLQLLNDVHTREAAALSDIAKELARNRGTQIYTGCDRVDEHGIERTTKIPVTRHTLDGQVTKEDRFVVEIERPQGCQYMNVHNVTLSQVFTCNTNVAAGDSGQTWYQTLYQCKHTQKEDRESRDIVAKGVMRRLLRSQEEREQRLASGAEIDDEVNSWVEGLSRVLSGINAATSRLVISAPMSHSLASNGGSRFHFSHEFVEILMGQMEAVLSEDEDEKKNVTSILRKCGNRQWSDISANDYIFRPDALNDFCFYHQSMYYTKKYKQGGYNDPSETETTISGTNLKFKDDGGHPGRGFAYLIRMMHVKIPITSIPDGKLCRIEELDLENDHPSRATREKREEYAKIALLMFCPFRELNDLKDGGSLWAKFDSFRRRHVHNEQLLQYREKIKNSEFTKPPKDLDASDVGKQYLILDNVSGGSSAFWIKGFEILQNMEDRMSVEKCQGRASDRLSDETKYPEGYSEEDDNALKTEEAGQLDDEIKDISFYCDDYEIDEEDDNGVNARGYNLANLVSGEDITNDRLIDARLASDMPIIAGADDQGLSDISSPLVPPGMDHGHGEMASLRDRDSYMIVLKLIKGTLLGGHGRYEDVYSEQSDDSGYYSVDCTSSGVFCDQDSVSDTDLRQVRVPTLAGIARRVLADDGKRLDEKQYIMYEVIACSFLLGLLSPNDRDDDGCLALERMLSCAAGGEMIDDMKSLKQMLEDRGGREQLIMFVTGFAGAGKSTAIKVAQTFCYEFCKAASIMWEDNTYLFTAYTGSAAAAFGGLTTTKATYIAKKGLSDDDRKAFQGVRILIIDEISFLKDSELLKIDRNLKNIADSRKPFGGYSIIFAGDFSQCEPVGMTDKEKLWHPFSSRHFENNINCCIILDGLHRFKDDEEYGLILQRLCSGDLTQADVDRINERVVGTGGVALPRNLEGDTCYACSKNSQRNAITAAIFREHLRQTHPEADSAEEPPGHTVIIKGLIEPSISSDRRIGSVMRRRIVQLGDNDMRQDTTLVSPHLCCYNGAYFMCNSNDKLKEQGIGNGTQGRLIRVKLREDQTSYKCEVWDGRKVWTVCASDVEFVEFEHYPIRNGVAKSFKLTPKRFYVAVKVLPHDIATETITMKCRVTQLPLNASDAITGHKLQGLTKDNVIVKGWNKSVKWIYTVLSRVRTLSGLFIFEKLQLRNIKPPSREYLDFLERMKKKENEELERAMRGGHRVSG